MASADFSRFVITACLEARPRDLSSYGRILSILCLPHLLQSFRIAIGLQCSLPPYPRPKALYVVPVRQARCLPRASFRFYLAIDTLASGWTLPAIRARWGFAPVRIRSCWTNKERERLSLSLVSTERRDGSRFLLWQFDGTIGALIAHDVLLQGAEQALGVLGCQDDTTLDLGLRHTGQHPGEVDDEVGARVCDDGKVSILSLRHVGRQFYLQSLLLVVLILFHCL